MFLFIVKTGIKNVWKQKIRFGGAGLCIFLFTITLFAATELSAAVHMKLEETEAQISEMEYEVSVEGSGSWEAQQSGDIIRNISNPLLIAEVCIHLLLVFLWLGAFILVFAIMYMILTERIRELQLYRLLGFPKSGILKLLLAEDVVLACVMGAVSYFAGCVIMSFCGSYVWEFFGVGMADSGNMGGMLPQYLLVYLAAMAGASVWFMQRMAKEI